MILSWSKVESRFVNNIMMVEVSIDNLSDQKRLSAITYISWTNGARRINRVGLLSAFFMTDGVASATKTYSVVSDWLVADGT